MNFQIDIRRLNVPATLDLCLGNLSPKKKSSEALLYEASSLVFIENLFL